MHDPSVGEDDGLVEAVGAAAGLPLENERLQAELRARVAELAGSRARLVQAADDERHASSATCTTGPSNGCSRC